MGAVLSLLLTGVIARFGEIPAGVAEAFSPDLRVLGATLLVALAAGLLFGLAPAFTVTHSALTPALKNEAVSFGPEGRRHRLRDGLVVAQVAVALVLIVTAGLFTKSLSKAVSADPGFTAREGLYLSFDLDRQRYDAVRQSTFRRDALRTIAAVPGVQSAALATTVPFGGHYEGNEFFREGAGGRDGVPAFLSGVTPQFFVTLGVPLAAGRAFTDRDDASGAPVMIVN